MKTIRVWVNAHPRFSVLTSALAMLAAFAGAVNDKTAVLMQSSTSWQAATGNDPNYTTQQGPWILTGNHPMVHSLIGGGTDWQQDITVSAMAFGCVGDGVTDDAPCIRNAIAVGRGNVYFPKPPVSYLVGGAIVITTPVHLYGDQTSASLIERGYSPSVDSDGVFNFRDGSGNSSISNIRIQSKVGQTGGCLISAVQTSDSDAAIGLYRFDFLDLTTTGTSTHNYSVYFDGSAKVSAPIGIRGVDFTGTSIFGGALGTMYIKSVLKLSFVGGGVYTAGGVSTSAIIFTGTSTVPTQSFLFEPADCSTPFSFDWATLGVFGCGVVGGITNTANTSYIVGSAFAGTSQNNWTFSHFYNSNGNITDDYTHTIRSYAPDATNTALTLETASTWTSGYLLRLFNNAAERFRFTVGGVMAIVSGGVIGDIIGGTGTLYLGGSGATTINLGTLGAAPVNIAAGSGSATAQLSGTLHGDATVVASVTSGETTASTYTIPANTLNANGQMIEMKAGFTHAANTNSTTHKVYFAGTAIDFSTNAGSSDVVTIRIEVIRTTTTTATYSVYISSAAGGTQRLGGTLSALNFASTIDTHTSVTGATTNGDLSSNYFRVQYWP